MSRASGFSRWFRFSGLKMNRRTAYLACMTATLLLGIADGVVRAVSIGAVFSCMHTLMLKKSEQVFGLPTILGEEDLFRSFRGSHSRGRSFHRARRATGLNSEPNTFYQAADIRGDQNQLIQHQSIGGLCTKITDCTFDLVIFFVLYTHPVLNDNRDF